MKRLSEFIRSQRMTTQIVLLLLVAVLPMNIVLFLSARQMQNISIQQSRLSMEQTAALHMAALSQDMHSVENYLYMSMNNNPYINNLVLHIPGNDYVIDTNSYWQQLYYRTQWYDDADGYFFYLEAEDHFDVALHYPYVSKAPFREYFQGFDYAAQGGKWRILIIEEEKWLVMVQSLRNFYIGAMINLDKYETQIAEDLILDNAVITIQLDDGNSADTTSTIVAPNDSGELNALITFDSHDLALLTPLLSQTIMSVGLLFLSCIPFLIFMIRRLLIRPLANLRKAMGQFEAGNGNYRMPVQRQNIEAKELSIKFNSMADRLTQLKIQVYEKELERMDIEATNLRLQMNPHYILNCLNIIFSLAKSGQLDNIKIFTKYLADYLRYSLGHTHGEVCLRQEIDCIRNHLAIQKMRFPHQLMYTFDIAPDAEQIQIPPLLLLTFVENCTKHAVLPNQSIEIAVSAKVESDQLLLSVCDTGKGMDEATRCRLLSGEILEDEEGKHIGIWNSLRRLKILYEDRASINITEGTGGGTQILIKIPIGEENNDTSDC